MRRMPLNGERVPKIERTRNLVSCFERCKPCGSCRLRAEALRLRSVYKSNTCSLSLHTAPQLRNQREASPPAFDLAQQPDDPLEPAIWGVDPGRASGLTCVDPGTRDSFAVSRAMFRDLARFDAFDRWGRAGSGGDLGRVWCRGGATRSLQGRRAFGG